MRRAARMTIALLLAVAATAGPAGAVARESAPARPAVGPRHVHVTLHQVAAGLQSPVFVATPRDGSGRLFVVEQRGTVRVFHHGQLASGDYLDISGEVATGYDEQGLLSIAFHPGFRHHPYVYAAYTRSSDGALQVSRFTASRSGARHVAASTERHVIAVPHPGQLNHNAGQLLFDGKGRLLVTTGDGGGAGDPYDNARNLTSLNGKILRLNVDRHCGGRNYCIPSSNPFPHAKNRHKRAVFDWGLRNPWRVSFDRGDGRLWIADVGQDSWEEIDHVREVGGKDFGWSCREGRTSYRSDRCTINGKSRHLTGPVHVYSHGSGRCAVIGGFAYHGPKYPFAHRIYLYSDYCGGQLYGLLQHRDGSYTNARVGSVGSVTGYGQAADGELYAVDSSGHLSHVVFHRS